MASHCKTGLENQHLKARQGDLKISVEFRITDLRKDDSRKASKTINRRFTQMDKDRNPFKNITAETQRETSRQIAVGSRQ